MLTSWLKMPTLVPLEVEYTGNHGDVYGVEGRSNIVVFQVPPNSLVPMEVSDTMRLLRETGVTDCVLDLQQDGYTPKWKATRPTVFASITEQYNLRDNYAGLDVRDINHTTLDVPKKSRQAVTRSKQKFDGKILGEILDGALDEIPMQEEAIETN